MFGEAATQNEMDNDTVQAEESKRDHEKKLVKGFVTHCSKYQKASYSSALFQLANTMIPFLIIVGIMLYSFSTAYWITALLTIPAVGFLVRIFIIQHDCGHGSFFPSRKWNNRVGRIMSIFTWTPYDFWRKTHNMHHSASGNLDGRGFGAIETITVAEYEALDSKMKFWYRMYRNPYIMLLVGNPYFIIVAQRFPLVNPLPFFETDKSISPKQIYKSVFGLDIALIAFFGGLGLIFGFGTVLLVYLPIVLITAWLGGWLFYVQHQFEESYWERQDKWNYSEAAVLGSSYYDLHPILQWFTGNIGLHHIHHLNAKIPNYRLQECMDDEPALRDINRITLMESFKLRKLRLWDETKNKMVNSFPA